MIRLRGILLTVAIGIAVWGGAWYFAYTLDKRMTACIQAGRAYEPLYMVCK